MGQIEVSASALIMITLEFSYGLMIKLRPNNGQAVLALLGLLLSWKEREEASSPSHSLW